MLEIHNVEDLNSKNLNIVRKKTKKTQIFLYDTNRRYDDFINKIKFRKNGDYSEIPHFIVTKLGIIYQLFDTKYYSDTFNESQIDKRFIKIAIENLGWLKKNTITGFLYNWIGDTYRSEPFICKWRGHYFWDKYNEVQIESISLLIKFLCDKHNILKKTVPSQGFFEQVINFDGVICKSNFSNLYTDINPSFKLREIIGKE